MACGALSQDLVLPCGAAVGGVFSFYVTEYVNLASSGVTISGNTVISTTSFLAKGAKFWNIPQKKQSGSYTENATPNVPNGSLFYNQEVSIVFPRLSATMQGIVSQLAINDVMVIVKDNNGTYWLLGSDKGLTLTAGTGATGKAYGDLNGYTITIGDSGETYRAPQIPSSLIPSLIAVAP